jgi:hypothetical protein
MLSVLALVALVLVLSGCTTAYWTRPGAKLDDLASESQACYVAAVDGEYPAAFPAAGNTGGRLLPPTEPPPQLWNRSPRQAGFERFDEQLRYERCMRQRGWSATRS